MIDAQGQANRWIRNTYANANLKVMKLTEKDFLRTLEDGVRYGAPVLLENIEEELDPSLEPVLLKQTFKKCGQLMLRLGDSDVPYSDDFKFFITTKAANPHYMPEICIKVTVINFTVTVTGLEDQLLVDVTKYERPDLEDKRDKLIISIADDQAQLMQVEDTILRMLADATGNILDDEELMNTLEKSKEISSAIDKRIAEAEQATKDINVTRDCYRVVATRGSVLYFVIANLALVDPMYQYSLQFYKALFNQRLEKSAKHEELEARLQILVSDITLSMYNNVCRGLFEKDKLLYAFVIASSIQRHAGRITEAEWQAMMVSSAPNVALLRDNVQPEHTKSWLNTKSWGDFLRLEDQFPHTFSGLAAGVQGWQNYMQSDSPQSCEFPDPWNKCVSSFQKLLLLKTLREEKFVLAISYFVGEELGPTLTERPLFDLDAAYNDSTNCNPLIFILSPGVDPKDYLIALAQKKGKGGHELKVISLGQGQGSVAERMIEIGRQTGHWVCLQNCHLAISWLPRLEELVESTINIVPQAHSEYRLWLTSLPSPKFPVPVLQLGIKITNEPPRGLRANLARTFMDVNDEEYEGCSKPCEFKKLLFGLAFFNALVLERRKFGAVGWNIPYEWMSSDLKVGMMQVKMCVEDFSTVPWETLNVMVAEIIYGGRITDR
jgi:dynein heavy chain